MQKKDGEGFFSARIFYCSSFVLHPQQPLQQPHRVAECTKKQTKTPLPDRRGVLLYKLFADCSYLRHWLFKTLRYCIDRKDTEAVSRSFRTNSPVLPLFFLFPDCGKARCPKGSGSFPLYKKALCTEAVQREMLFLITEQPWPSQPER